MADLHLPGTPSNMKFPPHLAGKLKMVEHDVYNICGRVKEIDPRLYIVLQEGHEKPWVVMERVEDRVEMVSRYERLDASILDDLRRMLSIPFEHRMKELFKQVDAENKRAENAWKESETHERFMWDFRRALEESNIATPMWTRSFRNIKGVRKNGSR